MLIKPTATISKTAEKLQISYQASRTLFFSPALVVFKYSRGQFGGKSPTLVPSICCASVYPWRMEGSESEAIFDSLNLNPQLFVNEVLNMVDDVVDDAFDFFYQEASAKLNSEGAERSQDLRQGVDCIHNVIRAVLDKRLAIWEKYCLRHCFSIPQSFVMQKSGNSTEDGSVCRSLSDPEIEAQLDSLRKKLTEVGRASEMLNQEVQALERRSTSNNGLINEILPLHDQNSFYELFQEIATTASEVETKMGNLKRSMTERTEQMNTNGIYSQKNVLSAADYANGLSNVKFEDLQEFLAFMKTGECLKDS